MYAAYITSFFGLGFCIQHVGMHIQLYSGWNISGSQPFVIEHTTESALSDELLEMAKSYIYGKKITPFAYRVLRFIFT
jgi:hypothetical protein